MNFKGKSGNPVEVDSDCRILVDAKSEWLLASLKGDAYIWTNETAALAGDDTAMSVRNDHSSKNLHIWKVKLHGIAESQVEIYATTAVYTPTGTAVVGVNLNRTTNKVAEATAIYDDTAVAQGGIVERIRIKADTDYEVDFGGAFILGHDQAIGIDLETANSECHVSVWGYFK